MEEMMDMMKMKMLMSMMGDAKFKAEPAAVKAEPVVKAEPAVKVEPTAKPSAAAALSLPPIATMLRAIAPDPRTLTTTMNSNAGSYEQEWGL